MKRSVYLLVSLVVLAFVCVLPSMLLAQQSKCVPGSFCAGEPCQNTPAGPLATCNCCPIGGGMWVCCDNVACGDCIVE